MDWRKRTIAAYCWRFLSEIDATTRLYCIETSLLAATLIRATDVRL